MSLAAIRAAVRRARWGRRPWHYQAIPNPAWHAHRATSGDNRG